MSARHGLVETVFDGRYVKHWRGEVLCAWRCSRKWHAKIIFFSFFLQSHDAPLGGFFPMRQRHRCACKYL